MVHWAVGGRADVSEKRPRLFYWEDAEDCWCPVADLTVADIVSVDFIAPGGEITIRFRRIDMTDDEFAAIPEAP